MTLILLGKTCSGKNVVLEILEKQYGYKRIVTYTTRPIRDNEKDGVTYHYISEEDFFDKINNDFFAEWKSYESAFGTWYYGTALNDLKKREDKSVIILTPEGFRDVKDKLGDETVSVYLYANNSTIRSRLSVRGDSKDEAERRITSDNKDFKGVENEVTTIICNNEETELKEVINKILEVVGGKN